MHDGDRRPLTVLMTADAVGGIWHYALALCAALPEIRFVLAVMGPMPSAAQRDAAGRLDNVVLEEYGHRLEWMQGAAGNLDVEPTLADPAGAALSGRSAACERLRACPQPDRAANSRGSPFRRAVVVARGAPRGGAAPSGDRYRREVVAGLARRRPGRGAYRRRARRSGAPLRVRPRLRHS